MTKAVWLAAGLVLGLAIGTAIAVSHAQEIDGAIACQRDAGCTSRPQLLEGLIDAAADADVDPADLLGALNTLADAGVETSARSYLIAVGELAVAAPPAVPASPPGWPFGGPLGQRIYCIEGIESAHGRYMWNPRGWPPPFFNEHAQGWLGWLPSTARRWGVAIGDRVSEWDGARRMLLAGAGGQFFGIASGRC